MPAEGLHLRYVPHFPAWPRENMYERSLLSHVSARIFISLLLVESFVIFVRPHNNWTICDSFISHVITCRPYNFWALFELEHSTFVLWFAKSINICNLMCVYMYIHAQTRYACTTHRHVSQTCYLRILCKKPVRTQEPLRFFH